MSSTHRHRLWVLLIVLLGGFFSHEAGHLQASRELAQQRSEALGALAMHRARLEGVLNATLHLTGGLASLVAVEGGVRQDRFNLLAQDLIGLNPHIRNIVLAPGNTIRMVYPLAGNEAALGLHYPDNAEQWPVVARAIELRRSVVAGPVNLVQGGIGIINRTPIFLRGNGEDGAYWGMVSSVINFTTLLEAAGLSNLEPAWRFALRGRDAEGAQGNVFWGDEGLFARDHLALEVRLPDGAWSLGIRPSAGWVSPVAWRTGAFWIGLLLTSLIASLAWLLLRKQRAISHLAMHDPLTELLNRRAFDHRLEEAAARQRRQGGSFAVLHLDLDGFKPINDTLGHAAGDQALRLIAERMRAVLRLDDVSARFGGDEFGILLQDSNGDALLMAEKVAAKMLDAINQPMHIDGHTVGCSVSIGIAACPDHTCEEGRLMRLADQTMYQAKAAGRGRWRVAKALDEGAEEHAGA